jgi:hypothetical protein
MTESCTGRGTVIGIGGNNGRLGNNIAQLVKGLYFGAALNMNCVYLDPKQHQSFLHNGAIFDLPEFLHLSPNPPNFSSRAIGCEGVMNQYRAQFLQHGGDPNAAIFLKGDFWGNGCKGADAATVHALAQKYLVPRLKDEFKDCLGSHNSSSGHRHLTIHLRGGDLLPLKFASPNDTVDHWLWRQPPCSMYDKIIKGNKYTAVLVLIGKPTDEFGTTESEGLHPCIPWLKAYGKKTNITVRIQSSSVLEDACAVYRARHLVLSYSTFGESLALLSGAARRLYHYNRFHDHSALNCKLWPHVKLVRFNGHATHHGYTNNVAGWTKRMTDYANVTGPQFISADEC